MAASVRKRRTVRWRRLSQLLFAALFIFLFIKTDYNGHDQLRWAVNILFRLDPFLGLSTLLAGKAVISLMLPSALLLVLSLVFGRFFCGWVCPLGALFDISHRLFGTREKTHAGGRRLKYGLLVFLLSASFFGLPLAGFIDPFSLLVRGLTFAVYPAFDEATRSFFTLTYRHGPGWLNAVTEPVYSFMKASVLPFADKVYSLSILSLLLLLVIVGLSFVERRFFCRRLCPLGALLAVCARFAPLRLAGGGEDCGACGHCRKICRMGAIDENREIAVSECILCLDCLDGCPRGLISYGLAKGKRTREIDLSRRAVVGSLAAGMLTPLVLPTRPLSRHADPLVIRPPGALAEKEFLGRCVRCGECMKVCIGNALQATWLEAGFEGMFSPRVMPRIGYCEYNCTLCGQVCPSGAIRRLARKEKQATVIGRAVFDKNRCLPYAKATPCIVCEEHCPTPDKAIKFREVDVPTDAGGSVRLRQPYVVDKLCIGCGICENKCPLSGRAAVWVTSEGESRNPDIYGGAGGYG